MLKKMCFILLVSCFLFEPVGNCQNHTQDLKKEMYCPPFEQNVVKNFNFSVYNHISVDTVLTYTNVCEWFPSFGNVFHRADSSYLTFMALAKNNKFMPSGFYQNLYIEKGQCFSFEILASTILGGSYKFDLQDTLDNLIVCLTNDSVELLSNGISVGEFEKQTIFELKKHIISYPPYPGSVFQGQFVANANYNKLFIYTYSSDTIFKTYNAINILEIKLTRDFTISAGPDSIIECGDEIVLGGSPTISGGSGNFEISWNSLPPGFTSIQLNPTVKPEEPTTYILTVKDIGILPNIELSDSIKITSNCCFFPIKINPGVDFLGSLSSNKFSHGSISTKDYDWKKITVYDSVNSPIVIGDDNPGKSMLLLHFNRSGRIAWAKGLSSSSFYFNNGALHSLNQIACDDNNNTYSLINSKSQLLCGEEIVFSPNHNYFFSSIIKFDRNGIISNKIKIDNPSGNIFCHEMILWNNALVVTGECIDNTIINNIQLQAGGFVMKLSLDLSVEWVSNVSSIPFYITADQNSNYLKSMYGDIMIINNEGEEEKVIAINNCSGGLYGIKFAGNNDFFNTCEDSLGGKLGYFKFENGEFSLIDELSTSRFPRFNIQNKSIFYTTLEHFSEIDSICIKLHKDSILYFPDPFWTVSSIPLPLITVPQQNHFGIIAFGNWPRTSISHLKNSIRIFNTNSGSFNCNNSMVANYKSNSWTVPINHLETSCDIHLYPNPASQIISFRTQYGANETVLSYKIASISDDKIIEKHLNVDINLFSVNISSLKNGVYLLTVITNRSVYQNRFVKDL